MSTRHLCWIRIFNKIKLGRYIFYGYVYRIETFKYLICGTVRNTSQGSNSCRSSRYIFQQHKCSSERVDSCLAKYTYSYLTVNTKMLNLHKYKVMQKASKGNVNVYEISR